MFKRVDHQSETILLFIWNEFEFFSTRSHRIIKLLIFTRLEMFHRPLLLLFFYIFFSFYPLAFPTHPPHPPLFIWITEKLFQHLHGFYFANSCYCGWSIFVVVKNGNQQVFS